VIDSSLPNSNVVLDKNSDSDIQPTSSTIGKKLESVNEDLVELMESLNKEFQYCWEKAVESGRSPDEMTVEVAFAFESAINAWVLSGKGSAGVKASFKWVKGQHG
ncbi:hypothetical protein L1D59_23480, partial [Pseudoalteromonas piscicida]|uniref:autophagy-related protein 17 n=2 Tax=Pseudoalteromonas TaxID=53246 RepID=UPI001EFD932A